MGVDSIEHSDEYSEELNEEEEEEEDEVTTEDQFLDLLNDAMESSENYHSDKKERFRSNKDPSGNVDEMSYQEAYDSK